MFTYRPESKQDTCIKCVRDDDCAICKCIQYVFIACEIYFIRKV